MSVDRVSRQLLARAWAAGAGPGDSPLPTWTSARPMDWPRRERATTAIPAPAAITHCWPSEVLMLREGRANTARGAAHCGAGAYGGARGQLTVRADSGSTPTLSLAAGKWMSASLSPSASAPVDSPPYWMDGAADVAETTYTPFQTKPDAAPVRLIFLF